MSSSVYAPLPSPSIPARSYPTLCAHDASAARARAISPKIIAIQGDRSINPLEARRLGFPELAGWLIPLTNIYGIVYGHILRPHNPPQGTGKYLFVAGFRPDMHVPLSHTHHVQDINVPVLWMESPVKANAAASAKTDTPILPVGGGGVYGFRGGKGVHSALIDGITPCHKKRGKVERSRKEYLGFDSDTATNDKVARARQRLTGIRQGQGADVWWIDLPAGPNGEKQGFDDVLASGVPLAEILGWAFPAPDCSRVPIGREDETPEVEHLHAELAKLQQENAGLRKDNATLVQLNTNRHAKSQAKAAVTRLVTIAMSKASRNADIDASGRVRVSAGEISGDYRCRPEKGQSQEPTNPDGSVPLMTRSTVKGLLEELRDTHKVLDFQSIKVRKTRAANGLPYEDTEFVIAPPKSLTDVLKPVAWLAPAEPKVRPYTRQEPCPACREVHSRTIVCDGCGAHVKHLPVPPEQDTAVYAASKREGNDSPIVDINTGEILDDPPISESFDEMAPAHVNSSVQKIDAMDSPKPEASYPPELWAEPPTGTYGHDRWSA